MKRLLFPVAASILMTLVSVEAALRLFDPAGIAYFNDLVTLFDYAVPDATGFGVGAHEIRFSHWSMHVGEDGLRITPDADPDGLTVHFYGDSLTMCWGVEDAACWVNRVSAALSLNGRNYGRNAYNAANIAALIEQTQGGHCAVFLTTSNDSQAPVRFDQLSHRRNTAPFTVQYIQWGVYANALKNARLAEHPTFDAAMTQIAARDNVLIIAYDNRDYGPMVAERYGAVLIPPYTHAISLADNHPNAAGNAEIAAVAAPVLAAWMKGRDCR